MYSSVNPVEGTKADLVSYDKLKRNHAIMYLTHVQFLPGRGVAFLPQSETPLLPGVSLARTWNPNYLLGYTIEVIFEKGANEKLLPLITNNDHEDNTFEYRGWDLRVSATEAFFRKTDIRECEALHDLPGPPGTLIHLAIVFTKKHRVSSSALPLSLS